MTEPTAASHTFGLMAEFDRAEPLIDAVKRAREDGFRSLDAFTPYPIEALTEALGIRDNRVPWLTLAGGVFGAASGYLLQVFTNLDYPLDIGGRPLLAWQAFLLITFELTVLFAVLFSIVGMLLLNHLPRLHHPLFNVAQFARASSDRFFLVIFSNDPRFDHETTRGFLEGLGAEKVHKVGAAEEEE